MTTQDDGRHEHQRDGLQDRPEFGDAQGGPEHEDSGHQHLLALRTDHMEVTVVVEPVHPDHVVLALVETRSGEGFSVSLTGLELEVLAFGLGRVAARVQKEGERR